MEPCRWGIPFQILILLPNSFDPWGSLKSSDSEFPCLQKEHNDDCFTDIVWLLIAFRLDCVWPPVTSENVNA